MFVDALTRVMNAQALTAIAVSASSIDLGAVTPKRQIGTGEPMRFALSIIASSLTTLLVEVISATDAALTAGILVHATRTFASADIPAGTVADIAVPQGTPTQQFLGLRCTPVGGAATATVTAWLTDADMVSIAPVSYAKGYTV
jgi:hypothetical protein